MKILFVASGNKKVGQVNAFVRSQYESLEKEGLEMRLFPIVGHGVKGYAKAIFDLRKIVRRERPDIIHAHYSVCGHVAWLACMGLCHKPKIVVSILGSFPTRNRKWKLVRYCVQHLWDATIVKSNRTAAQLGLPVHIIPNGVNLEVFQVMDYEEARRMVGFEVETKTEINTVPAINIDKDLEVTKNAHSTSVSSNSPHGLECNQPQVLTSKLAAPVIANTPNMPTDESHVECLQKTIIFDNPQKTPKTISSSDCEKKYVIWCSNPHTRPEKNWPLAEAAVKELENERISELGMVELVAVYDKTPEEVCAYMNAADCLLLTSDTEGSPNVIKEAMACNCPIVTTDVGDVTERLHDLEGCYVAPIGDLSFVICELAKDIEKALAFGKRTEGRKRIIADRLEIGQIAKRIKEVYEHL